MSMTPARLGAALACASPTLGKQNIDARTPNSIHIRSLIVRSLYCSRRDRKQRCSILVRSSLRDKRLGPLSIRDTPPLYRPPGMLDRDHSLYKTYRFYLFLSST